MDIFQIIKSQKTKYILSKYFYNLLQFLSILYLAKIIEIEQFAFYTSIKLILQYLSYTNLGINYAYINISSLKKEINKKFLTNFLKQSLTLNLFISLILGLPFVIILSIGNIKTYLENVDQIIIICVVIYLLSIFRQINLLFQGFFRLTDKLQFLNYYSIVLGITEILAIYFTEDKSRVVINIFICLMIVNLLFMVYGVVKTNIIKANNFTESSKELLRKAFSLLIYNLSFYGISLIIRSSVENYKSISEFGIFGFMSMFNDGIMLLLNGGLFLIMPKTLNLLGKSEKKHISELIKRKNSIIRIISLILIPVASIGYIFLTQFLPNFSKSFIGGTILLISNIFILKTFIYTLYLQKKNLEYISILIGGVICLFWFFMGQFGFISEFSLTVISILMLSSYFLYFLLHFSFLKRKKENLDLSLDWVLLAYIVIYVLIITHISLQSILLLNLVLILTSILIFHRKIIKKLKNIQDIILNKSDLISKD